MRLTVIAGITAFIALFAFSLKQPSATDNSEAVANSGASEMNAQVSAGVNSTSPRANQQASTVAQAVHSGAPASMNTALTVGNGVNFGPAPVLSNGGAPNPAADSMRATLSTEAHQLIAELSPLWARAAQTSAESGDNDAREFADSVLSSLAEMSMQAGLTIEAVEEVHRASSEQYEGPLGGSLELQAGESR